MNKIIAKVIKIKESGDLCHLFLSSDVGELSLVMLTPNLQLGDEIEVGFKESVVAVLVGENQSSENLSYSNKIKVRLNLVENGEILTKVVGESVEGKKGGVKITSLITSNSAKNLSLKSGDEVTFLVKATDMFVV